MLAFGGGQGGGNDRRGGVQSRSSMDVVQFQNVGGDAVGQRGARGRGSSSAEHGGFPRYTEARHDFLHRTRGRLGRTRRASAQPSPRTARRVSIGTAAGRSSNLAAERKRASARASTFHSRRKARDLAQRDAIRPQDFNAGERRHPPSSIRSRARPFARVTSKRNMTASPLLERVVTICRALFPVQAQFAVFDGRGFEHRDIIRTLSPRRKKWP